MLLLDFLISTCMQDFLDTWQSLLGMAIQAPRGSHVSPKSLNPPELELS